MTSPPQQHTKELTLEQLWRIYRRLLDTGFFPQPFEPVTVLQLGNEQKYRHFQKKIVGRLFREYVKRSEWVKQKLVPSELPSPAEKPTVLFLSYTNHLKKTPQGMKYFRIQHLIDGFNREARLSSLVLTIDSLSSFSPAVLRNTLHPYRYLNSEIEEKAKREGKRLHQEWNELSEQQRKELLSHPLSTELDEHLTILFSPELIGVVSLYYELFTEAIQREQVKAVYLSAVTSLYEKCLIAAASQFRIPVFMGQHGIGMNFAENIFVETQQPYFLVMGKKYQQELIKKGIAEDHAIVTGPQIFEELVPYLRKKKEGPAGRNILFLTSPLIEDKLLGKEEYFKTIREIVTQITTLPTIHLRIKLHPREKNVKEYQKILNELSLVGEVYEETTREKHCQLLWESDVVLNFGSTVALEAMIIGRPTVTINPFDGENRINPFIWGSRATTVVRYNENITETITSVLKSPHHLKKEVKEFIKDHCYKVDGKVTERVIRVMKEKMKE